MTFLELLNVESMGIPEPTPLDGRNGTWQPNQNKFEAKWQWTVLRPISWLPYLILYHIRKLGVGSASKQK